MDVLTQDELANLLREFRTRMKAHFGERIRAFRLFGSYAKGTPGKHSDVDVLVVLEPRQRTADDNSVIATILSDLCITHGVLVMPVFVSEQEYRERDIAFFRNVRRESIAV